MNVIIAGDFSLQGRLEKSKEKDVLKYLDSVVKYCNQADYSIVNFESPATTRTKPIIKDGPVLRNRMEALPILKSIGFNVVTLANNHLKDYGIGGVVDTLRECKEHGILVVGAGGNLTEARAPLILRKDEDIGIGILNVCEHESSIASKTSAGANPFNMANLFYDIRQLKEQVDKIVVIIHGGCEHYQLPTPRMKREYRLLVDYGADIIVNHHQHCYSGYEIYNGKTIFYGLGNFFFDNPQNRHDKWNEGVLLNLEITKENTTCELIPYYQCDDEPVIKIRAYDEIMRQIEELNAIISDDGLLEENFDMLVASKRPLYAFLPYGNHYMRALYYRGYLPDCMSTLRKVKMENAVSCETHRVVLLKYLDIILNKE